MLLSLYDFSLLREGRPRGDTSRGTRQVAATEAVSGDVKYNVQRVPVFARRRLSAHPGRFTAGRYNIHHTGTLGPVDFQSFIALPPRGHEPTSNDCLLCRKDLHEMVPMSAALFGTETLSAAK